MIRRILFAFLLMLLSSCPCFSQSPSDGGAGDDKVVRKSLLLSDLQALEAKADKIAAPLSRARAQAEIADAAWPLDREWAKKLLREAYELILPPEEERARLRRQPVGSIGSVATGVERARSEIRSRVLQVASRDSAFADELLQTSAQEMGKYEEHFSYTSMAEKSLADGETEKAGDYLLKATEADPTQMAAGYLILEMAAKDRKAADALILKYIEQLRRMPLSQTSQSAWRPDSMLTGLVFPAESLPLVAMFKGPSAQYQQIEPAGAEAIRAYVGYVITSMGELERREPGSARELRKFLLLVWPPLRQYAPELAGAFSELEALSRRPGERVSLPAADSGDGRRNSYEERIKSALDSRRPEALALASKFALSQRDYAAARKMIDLLPDGEEKTKLTEEVNAREAVSLAAGGDINGAQRLAAQLTSAPTILQAYPLIIEKCIAKKDSQCATALTYQAMKQMRGLKGEATASLSLSKLAAAVAPVNETLALEALDEAVRAANDSSRGTEEGRVGLDVGVFRKLAAKNEPRVRQAAENLKDELPQVVALATVYRWKAEELTKGPKGK